MKLTNDKQETFDALSMVDKVSILLMQLGDDTTTMIFKHLRTNVIILLTESIAKVKTIDQQIAMAVVEDFYGIFEGNNFMSAGGINYARDLLLKTLPPDEAKRILDRLNKNMDSQQNFAYLHKVKPAQLAEFISEEHPQTIALILAHMDSSSAADVLATFSDSKKADVALRIANLDELSPTIVKKISAMLENKLELLSDSQIEVGGSKSVAEIFNRLGQAISKSTLDILEQKDHELTSIIKEMMFTFDDILELDQKVISEILKVTDNAQLALALKGASEEMRNKFMAGMSQRAAEAFNEELGFMGAVKLKDVEGAQRKIVETVQKLAESGVIEMNNDEEIIE
jgi:flagellar motor switch protein FliG